MLSIQWACVQFSYSDIWVDEMQKIRWFFLILAIAVMLAAVLQNNHETKINLLWLEQTMPLSVLLLVTSAIGFLLGAVVTAAMLRSRRKKKEAATKKAGKSVASSKANESPLKPATN